MDSPLLAAARGGNVEGRSPGLNTLKDAFNIAYAVHRAEEENARRRRYCGRGGVGMKDFLGDLNEEHEDEDDDTEDDDARGRTHAAGRQAQHQGQGTNMRGELGQQTVSASSAAYTAPPATPDTPFSCSSTSMNILTASPARVAAVLCAPYPLPHLQPFRWP
jgi:serine/threonine-protein kinase RCK2